jgi:hypothetical protein
MTPEWDIKGWRRRLAWLRVLAGALAVLFATKAAQVRAASEADKSSTTEVPSSWQAFAARLQLRFQERLSSDNKNASRLRDSMIRRAKAAGTAPTVIVRAWILTDGKVSRVELESQPSESDSHDLEAVLIGETIGAVPPDMPQPLRLRLTLGQKARPEN